MTDKLKYKIIMYLLLPLCAICISFHLIIYVADYTQKIQESGLASINNECENSDMEIIV